VVYQIDGKRPRDIYLEACHSIGSSFSRLGFRYVKSGPRIYRKIDDLTFEIVFRSSYKNAKDYKVTLESTALIKSKQLKNWRGGRPEHISLGGECLATDIVTAYQVGRWNLIAKNPLEITAIIHDELNEYVLHVLELYESSENIILDFRKYCYEPTLGIGIVQYFISQNSNDLARIYALRLLERREKFKKEYSECINDGILEDPPSPNFNFSLGRGLAYYSLIYGWGNLIS